MKRFAVLTIAILTALAYFSGVESLGITWFRPVPSIAAIEIDGSRLTVSDGPESRATYIAGVSAELTGKLIDYTYGDIGDFTKLGGRGVIGFLTTKSYDTLLAEHESTGVCMANLLEQFGVPHLYLIPRDRAALLSMRKVIGKLGNTVTLTGQHMLFESAEIAGTRLQKPIGNMPIEYFLLDSITIE